MQRYRNPYELKDEIYKEIEAGCLVQAFYKNEYSQYEKTAVPVDQILIDSVINKYYLFLPKGEFVIRVLNKNKDVTAMYTTKVK